MIYAQICRCALHDSVDSVHVLDDESITDLCAPTVHITFDRFINNFTMTETRVQECYTRTSPSLLSLSLPLLSYRHCTSSR